MMRVVGLGACVLDTLISCSTFPTEDTKVRAEGILQAGGGPVANALVVMSKLGTEAEVIGTLALDSAGKYMLADFEKWGVGTRGVKLAEGKSSFVSYITLSADTGSRTCVYDRGTVEDDPSELSLSRIDGAGAKGRR